MKKFYKKNSSRSHASKRPDVYKMIVDKITEMLEKGECPWRKPWGGVPFSVGGLVGAVKYSTGEPYSLLNQFLLGKEGEWLTFEGAVSAGGRVKPGEKSSFAVYWDRWAKEVETDELDENGEPKKEKKWFWTLKYIRLFHIDQCEGVPSKLEERRKRQQKKLEQRKAEMQPFEAAEEIIRGYLEKNPTLGFHNDKPSNRAFYSPLNDSVTVPMLAQFKDTSEYYSTTFHELVHSTLKKERCDREDENAMAFFGNHEYSREELVAELGASMLCSIVGISSENSFKNNVAYIQSWLKALQNDKQMIVWAASRAEKAAKYIQFGKAAAEEVDIKDEEEITENENAA